MAASSLSRQAALVAATKRKLITPKEMSCLLTLKPKKSQLTGRLSTLRDALAMVVHGEISEVEFYELLKCMSTAGTAPGGRAELSNIQRADDGSCPLLAEPEAKHATSLAPTSSPSLPCKPGKRGKENATKGTYWARADDTGSDLSRFRAHQQDFAIVLTSQGSKTISHQPLVDGSVGSDSNRHPTRLPGKSPHDVAHVSQSTATPKRARSPADVSGHHARRRDSNEAEPSLSSWFDLPLHTSLCSALCLHGVAGDTGTKPHCPSVLRSWRLVFVGAYATRLGPVSDVLILDAALKANENCAGAQHGRRATMSPCYDWRADNGQYHHSATLRPKRPKVAPSVVVLVMGAEWGQEVYEHLSELSKSLK